MSEKQPSKFEDRNIDQEELAYRQALQYGQDMVAVYKQERQKREALEIAYKKLEAALVGMNDGYLVLDKDLTITEINQACANLFDLNADEAQGKSLPKLLIGPEIETFFELLAHTAPKKRSMQVRIDLPMPRALSIDSVPLPDGGWVLVLHDITWEDRVSNMREEFLHLAAHELRTPLAGVIGFTSLLEQISGEQAFDPQFTSILDNILKSSEKLRSAINDLINSSLGDSQGMEITSVDLGSIVTEALLLFTKPAAEHQVSINANLPTDSLPVFGNRKMLVTAVGHLIENGIRYNKPGGTLTIESKINDNTYNLLFSDTGKGIARKDLDYILQPFFQVEKHTTRQSVGMGLGLSIVNRTVALHRGTIDIQSKLGSGSTFTVNLPRYSVEDLATAKEELVKMQNQFAREIEKQQAQERYEAQTIIKQLEEQLRVTQTQNVAYARDLATLYQTQRAGTQTLEHQKAQMGHTDRLALMGQLAAGVAHDLSNLISPILGYSQIILRRRDSIDPTMADIIERILSTSRRANLLLRQMVTLSKAQSDKPEFFGLNKHISETLNILEIKIKHANIDLIESYADDLPDVYGNPIQISQVILNIVVNAIDAMQSGGVLTIKTSLGENDGKKIIRFQISDTGYGIEAKNLTHIFEAFFTTKEEKSGTGLGLSVTKQIMDSHNGQILVDSKVGKGTTFTIELPILEKEDNLNVATD